MMNTGIIYSRPCSKLIVSVITNKGNNQTMEESQLYVWMNLIYGVKYVHSQN